MADDTETFELELTWLKDRTTYNLGDEEFHLAFRTDDMEAAHALHEKMGCICYENPAMGIASSRTRTDTGWKSFQWANKQNKQSGSRSTA